MSDTLTKEQIDRIVNVHGAGIGRALEDASEGQRAAKRPAIYPSDGRFRADEPKSIGDAFVTSDAYRSWIERFPSGGPAGPGEYRSDPVGIRQSMRDASRHIKARSLFTTADTSGGALSDAQYGGPLAGGLVRLGAVAHGFLPLEERHLGVGVGDPPSRSP